MRRVLGSAAAAALVVVGIASCTSGPPEATPSAAAATTGNPAPGLHTVRLTVADGAHAGRAAGRSLRVPDGWRAEVWADAPGARMAAWLPDAACS